jgi:signal transduction histidine kinase
MTQLLNDVILIGQAEAGQLKFNPTQVDLESLCGEIVEEWQFSLDSQRVGLKALPLQLLFQLRVTIPRPTWMRSCCGKS